ncbi:hypothetical protein [Rufibacter roseolus]|uniref:hypothetical protein n=1 Tax=Rufibacter roseolus TaxID=2817375 RepID=UPI001B314FA1|nr:hypothetical protein [Rufibacter roseolus]
MGNFYNSPSAGTPEYLDARIAGKLLYLLQSEAYERGEAIEEVLLVATSYREILRENAIPEDAEHTDGVTWHLDSLILEAENMQNSPKNDLFLYLRAFHSFKEKMKDMFPFLNISTA